MEIKIECPCGQDYAFEVEPVNGSMPCTINCPTCGVDGTHLANEVIAQAHVAPPAQHTMAPAAVASPAAAPSTGGLRINRPAAAPAPASPETAEAPSAPPQKIFTRAMTESPETPLESDENIPLGILGGLIAGAIAMVGWYFVTTASGRDFGILAWLVGIVTGLGVRMLGRDSTALLGTIAAICACLAILGGKFMATNHIIHKVSTRMADQAYQEQLENAKEGLNAKSDQDIKNWIAKNDKTEGEIPQKEIERFREQRLAKMQAFVDGKPSRAEFEKTVESRINTWNFRYKIFQSSISLFTILFLCFGIASAYRIASG
jgi:hypothetical protein